MSFLKNIRIAKKIGGGFAIVLSLLVVLAGFGVISLTAVDHYFTDYRSLARQAVEIGQVQSNLLETRIGIFKYMQGSNAAVDDVSNRGQAALATADGAKKLASEEDVKKRIEDIQARFEVYLASFDELKVHQEARDKHVAVLGQTGPAMEHAMAELMQEARKSNDAELAVSAGITMRHLLLSRLSVAKYLVDNSEQALVSAQSQMSFAMQAGKNMRRMVNGTKQSALLADFLSAEQGYVSALDAAAAAIQSRNEIFGGKLGVIGPEISAAIEEIKLQAKQQQDAIGPAAAAAIDQTHMMNYVLSGLAIVIGSIAAIAIARGIVKPISGMTVAMDRLAHKDLNVHIPATDHKDEVGDMAKAMQVFKDNMVRAEELSQQQEKERLERIRRAELIEALNRDFDAGISEVLSTVAAASQQLQASASTMTAIASESTDRATTVAAAAEEASANVQTVATAAEELSASISEIGRQVQRSSEIAADAASRAEVTHDRVRGLSRAANKIGEVVQLITDIAEQTNLLALNATIEAARAGDAGKGFAVVASEVKNLANQTAKATDEIAQQIGSVQFETEEAVKAIDDIVRIVEEINDVSGSIASAVEEQNAATSEIARNVQEAAAGTEEVTTTIAGVSKAAGEAGAASTQVLSASEDLNSQSRHLQSMVDKFLADVRAA